jgi:hypothetical protein
MTEDTENRKAASNPSDNAEPTCPWLDADECAMVRERSVAGISDVIPACPVHGPHPDMPAPEAGPLE